MSMRILQIVLLMSALSQRGFSQETFYDGCSYFFLSFKLPIIAVRDVGHSPLIYRGIEPTLRAGFTRRKPDNFSEFSIDLGLGELAPRVKPLTNKILSSASSTRIVLSYKRAYRVNNYNSDGANSFAGFDLNYSFVGRNYALPSNNLFAFNSAVAISALGMFQNKTSPNWLFGYEVSVPVVSLVHRPDYIGLLALNEGGNLAQRILKSGTWATFNKKLELNHKLTFTQSINNHRMRALSYDGEYLQQFISNPLHSTLGGLGYTELFKL